MTIIQPSSGWASVGIGEVFRYRELLYFLVWAELRARYKQTVLGVAWAVLRPLSIMLVFAVFFGLVVRVDTGDIYYPVFAFSGVVAWTYFAGALGEASNSLLRYEYLITKVYFPRLLVPISTVLAGLVDFAMAFAVLVVMVLFFGYTPTVNVWALPLFVLLAMATALAVSLWLSALNVQYRDVRLLVPILIQLWFFATPIIYPSALIESETWNTVYHLLNPMASVVEGIRWTLLGGAGSEFVPDPSPTLAVTVPAVAILLVGGLYYFRRVERTFADVV